MGLPHLASSHPGSPSRAVSYCSWPADAFVAMFVPTYCSSAAGGQVLYAIRTVVTRHACWGSAFWNLGAPMQEGCSWADATVVSMSIGCPFTCGISGLLFATQLLHRLRNSVERFCSCKLVLKSVVGLSWFLVSGSN